MTTDPSSDVLERLRVATADPWRLHMPDGAMLLHCDIVEALATIERLSAERMQLREALELIADAEEEDSELGRIARAALSNTAENG